MADQSTEPQKAIQKPTISRIVHVFPAQSDFHKRNGLAKNGAEKCGAFVTRVGENLTINAHVFPDHQDVYFRTNIPHKSTVPEGTECWDWPEKA